MNKFLFPILALALTGCSLIHDDSYEAELKARYREQRIETVAKNLIDEGKAADMTQARPLAETVVDRELAEQKAAERENERASKFFNEGDKRAE